MTVQAPRFTRLTRDWTAAPLLWFTVPVLLALGALAWRLAPEWTANPDLSHGLFTPLVFLFLLHEGMRHGTPRWFRDSGLVAALGAALAAGALALFAFSGLLAASVGWSHALVDFSLAAALTLFLGAALIPLAHERVRAVPLNWPVCAAIGLWLLSAPIPPGTYARLTLLLQSFVTGGVLDALHILGIPARQTGNIIQLAGTSVGVEEACSGVRSLLSCLYAGLVFSAWLVRRPGRRAALLVLAPLLALAMNFLRSLALTLLADAGVDIMAFWHDATGYAILGATALVLATVAAAMGTVPIASITPTPPPPAPGRIRGAIPVAATAALAAALGIFFATFGRGTAAAEDSAVIPVEELLPAEAAGWTVVSQKDLARFTPVLRTDHLVERTYLRTAGGDPVLLNAYVAHWPAGRAPVSLVATHTPEWCWPGGGWVQEELDSPQIVLELAGARLPIAEQRLFRHDGIPQQVWFWHVYDGRVINYRAPYSVPALVEIALRYGFRRQGPQYFVRFSSNRPWEQIRDEPLVREIFTHFRRIGVRP